MFNHDLTLLDQDPSNYLTYFKRAAVYLAIGQAKKAIPDLDKTIGLKPDFSQVQNESCNLVLSVIRPPCELPIKATLAHPNSSYSDLQ